MSVHEIWGFFVCVLKFHVFVIFFCVSLNRVTRAVYDTISYHSNISTSPSISNSTSIFLKDAFHANPGVERKYAGASLYILIQLLWKLMNTCPKNSLSLWTYTSWYLPRFIFHSSPNLFSSIYKHHLYCLLLSGIYFLVMMLHWIFSLNLCTHMDKYFFVTLGKFF